MNKYFFGYYSDLVVFHDLLKKTILYMNTVSDWERKIYKYSIFILYLLNTKKMA